MPALVISPRFAPLPPTRPTSSLSTSRNQTTRFIQRLLRMGYNPPHDHPARQPIIAVVSIFVQRIDGRFRNRYILLLHGKSVWRGARSWGRFLMSPWPAAAIKGADPG